jgi:LmbE family N-acetylglucosaminyl deacetylase
MAKLPRRCVVVLVSAGLGCAGVSTVGPAQADVPGCRGRPVMTVVAHQDDDLVFMSPDVLHNVEAGRCVQTLFLTAGDAGLGPDYWRAREDGAKAAYSSMARLPSLWTDEDVLVAGKLVHRATMAGQPRVSLVFLRLPDGFAGQGSVTYGNESLQKLWERRIPVVHSVDRRTTYTRAELIGTVRRLMQDIQPEVVRLHTYQLRNPRIGARSADHHDHVAAGYFGYEAQRQLPARPRVLAYVGYPTRHLPSNVPPEETHRKRNAFYAYAAHDRLVRCKDDASCAGQPYDQWLTRQYPTSASPPRADELASRTESIEYDDRSD